MSERKSIVERIPWAFHGYPDQQPTLKDTVEWETRQFSQMKFERPYFAFITPMWNTPPHFLEELIESCQAQSFPFWELILVDDGSKTKDHLIAARQLAEKDKRIKVFEKVENEGISESRNYAIDRSTADYLAILDHDDLVHPRILAHFFQLLKDKRPTLVFSNEVKIDQDSQKLSQFFYKPDFDRATVRLSNYIAHFAAVRRDAALALKAQDGAIFRSKFDGVEDHDYFLRLSALSGFEALKTEAFGYLWRKSANSTSESLDAKPYVKERLKNLIVENSPDDVVVEFPKTPREKYPARTFASQPKAPEKLLVWVWGKDISKQLAEQIKTLWPNISLQTKFSDFIPDGLQMNDKLLGKAAGSNFALIIDGRISNLSTDVLEKCLKALENLPGYGSITCRIIDENSHELGDIAIQRQWGSGLVLRSHLTETDFPCDQRQGQYPLPYFLLARSLPDEVFDMDLSALFQGIRGRAVLAKEYKHYYDGRIALSTQGQGLYPEKLSLIYEDDSNQKLLNHLKKTSMVYDPDQRWLHASRLKSDWYEVPKRYQIADSVNTQLKGLIRPLHLFAKKIMK